MPSQINSKPKKPFIDVFVWISNSTGTFVPTTKLDFGNLKDCQQVKMSFRTNLIGNLIDTQSPLLDGATEVVKAVAEIRAGDNLFFRFVENVGNGTLKLHNIGMVNIRKHVEHGKIHFSYAHTVLYIQFFSDCRELVTFQLSGQPELVEALKNFVAFHKKVPGIMMHNDPEFVNGTVKWFNPFTLNGMIADKNGDVHFHLNEVLNFSAWRRIVPGTKVTYLTRASGRTTVKKEAFWIMVK